MNPSSTPPATYLPTYLSRVCYLQNTTASPSLHHALFDRPLPLPLRPPLPLARRHPNLSSSSSRACPGLPVIPSAKVIRSRLLGTYPKGVSDVLEAHLAAE
ncbi:hypothetical protein IF2G_03152 [Cordyceps javanica]|nr:hypothetical protein IF2G_03152 [Cordyceps javanica]